MLGSVGKTTVQQWTMEIFPFYINNTLNAQMQRWNKPDVLLYAAASVNGREPGLKL